MEVCDILLHFSQYLGFRNRKKFLSSKCKGQHLNNEHYQKHFCSSLEKFLVSRARSSPLQVSTLSWICNCNQGVWMRSDLYSIPSWLWYFHSDGCLKSMNFTQSTWIKGYEASAFPTKAKDFLVLFSQEHIWGKKFTINSTLAITVLYTAIYNI